jgi:predicted ATPase
MITSFRVQNFKSLVDIGEKFTPQALNVIIGPNGSGKSSLLQAIDFLRAFFMSSVELYLQEKGWDFRDIPNLRQTSKVIRWDLTVKLDGDEHGSGAGRYEYSIRLSPKRYLTIGSEQLRYAASGGSARVILNREGRKVAVWNSKTRELEVGSYRVPASVISTYDPSRDRLKYPELLRFREWIERFRYFLIWDPKILRSPDRNKHEEIGPSGEHLAPLLALLKQRSPDKFDKLLRRVRNLFPHVSDISISGSGGGTWGWKTIRIHERDDGRDVAFNSRQTNDGVLRMLAVTSLLYLPKPPSVVMFEEPENGIHPQLLREVVQILRELTLRKPPNQCQVFFTTHSPYVLDEFYDHPEEVFVMERSHPQSGASIFQLGAASQLPGVKNAFESMGEAWFSGLIGGTARGKNR